MRILAWCLLPVLVAEVTSVVLLHRLLHAQVDDRVAAGLQQEVAELRSLIDLDATGDEDVPGAIDASDPAVVFDTFLRRNIPSDNEAMVTFVDGTAYNATPGLPASVLDDTTLTNRWADLDSAESGVITTAEGQTAYLAVPLRRDGVTRGVFVVLNFLDAERSDVDDTIRTVSLVSFVVLLVATLLAWLASGRVLAPVRVITDTARSITETDITRRIPVSGNDEIAELSTTFNAMLDRLEASLTTQRNFMDDASHELRTPITIIRGHLELMGDDPDERREVVEIVTDELDRMSRLVDEMLLLAKSERPGFLQREPVDMASITLEWVNRAAGLADRNWQVEDQARVIILADAQRLTQAVLNLATNAARHTVTGDVIRLGSAVVGDTVRIWVRDTGPGIALEDQERIFQRFAQGASRQGRGEGVGLGLAIVRAIVEAHGGTVEVASVPGEGALFTLVIPSTELTPDTDRGSQDPWRAS